MYVKQAVVKAKAVVECSYQNPWNTLTRMHRKLMLTYSTSYARQHSVCEASNHHATHWALDIRCGYKWMAVLVKLIYVRYYT